MLLEVSILHKIGNVVANLSGTSVRLFFFLTARTAQFLFREIEKEIKDIVTRFHIDKKEDEFEKKLEILRHHYDATCRFVDQVNEIFGPILLFNLAWIFYRSFSSFCDFFISYAFILIISLHFDLLGMSMAVRLLDIHYKNSFLRDSASYDFLQQPLLYETLQMYYAHEVSSYITIAYSALVFVTIWSRLLVILVSSNHLQKQVILYFLTCRLFFFQLQSQ